MPKITPTSILPYTKTSIPATKEFNSENTTRALSADPPIYGETVKDVLGVVSATAA